MLTRHNICSWPNAALTVLAVIAVASPAPAQSVRWLTDYNAARKEAAERGRPILLDFGTEQCVWCKRQDLTTFRDAVVARTLNEKFVALKVDAERESLLTQSLRVTQFPTIVLAGPDGKILGVLEGYQEAERLNDHLQKVVAAYAVPEWMNRDFQEASLAVAASNYARAIVLLKGVLQDGKERPVQVKARQILTDLEQQAAGRLARAKSLHDRGLAVEATQVLADVLTTYSGTLAASDSAALLTTVLAKPEVRDLQRSRRARELLAQAKDDFRTQQYLGCLEKCEVLTAGYADLPEGPEADQLASSIKDNPDFLSRACDSLSERAGIMYLALAEGWIKKGQPQQALPCLERAAQAAPGTRQAQLAAAKLSQLKGETTHQAEFKRVP